MTFITHGFRVSVVSDVRERVRDFRITFTLYVNFGDFVRNDNSNKGTTARLNETRFGPKNKSSPIYLGPKISTLFDVLDEREIAR